MYHKSSWTLDYTFNNHIIILISHVTMATSWILFNFVFQFFINPHRPSLDRNGGHKTFNKTSQHIMSPHNKITD